MVRTIDTIANASNADTVDNLHQSSFLRCDSTSSGNPLNANFAIGVASSRNFIQSHGGYPLDLNPLGNLVTINGNTAYHTGNLTGTQTGHTHNYAALSNLIVAGNEHN